MHADVHDDMHEERQGAPVRSLVSFVDSDGEAEHPGTALARKQQPAAFVTHAGTHAGTHVSGRVASPSVSPYVDECM